MELSVGVTPSQLFPSPFRLPQVYSPQLVLPDVSNRRFVFGQPKLLNVRSKHSKCFPCARQAKTQIFGRSMGRSQVLTIKSGPLTLALRHHVTRATASNVGRQNPRKTGFDHILATVSRTFGPLSIS
jgi:hypothetical protein